MANYYNNNNRPGMYGNPQNYYGQPNNNMYPHMNYNRPQGNYQNNNYNMPYQYNQNKNPQPQQQNYNNMNQQNNGPKPFISGNMGRILISSETLESFQKSLKTTEWTNNQNYLQAKNINVRMKLSLSGKIQTDNNNISLRNRFSNIGFRSNFNYKNFCDFITKTLDYKKRQEEQKVNDKNNFIKNNFPNEKSDIKVNDLFMKIGEKRKDILMKDSSLYPKVEKLIPLLKVVERPKENNCDGDFSIFNNNTNNNNNNNEKKLFSNSDNGTPGI